MKKAFGAILLGSMIFLSACGGGKPNLDDAAAVAKYSCGKLKEVIDLMKAEKPDENKIVKISEEMESFDKELRAHHGDKYSEFEVKFEAEIKKTCPDASFD
jgi:hypothetical protein